VAADWHYAAIHCPDQLTVGPTVQPADISPPQSATLGLQRADCKLQLILHPTEGRRLSCPKSAIMNRHVLFTTAINIPGMQFKQENYKHSKPVSNELGITGL